MHLYNLTLQRASGITHAVHGNFSGAKQQEIAVAKGKVLELLKPDPLTGKILTLHTTEVFGTIRTIMPFRLTGGNKDYLVVGSDSGRIVILEYQPARNVFEKVQQETYGKSGCRRIIPGQYLAIDPKGRAVMVGAIEKQKLVYIMNRDSEARLTISSPLEAHKSNTFVYHIAAVDVGFENPTFACIEMDYEEADQDSTGEAAHGAHQVLTYYELDLGLNHVVRKYLEPLEEHANFLITVPGGTDGPSGILICSENYITYKNLGTQPDIRCPIPQRRHDLDDPDRGILFVCSASHKTKNLFFFLAQTEQGDIFKINLEIDEDMVTEIKVKYFDTVPVATSMCVLKTGFLFVAAEFGNHYLYQIARLGDEDDEPEFSSAMPLEEGETFYFAPRSLRNLNEVDMIESLSPILDLHVADFANEDTPQLAVACGRGPRSTFRLLRHGLEVSEMAKSDLPGNPNAVWTVKRSSDETYDAYIVVSFVNATLILSIGETVEEVTDSGFAGTNTTLMCAQLGDDALVQIYPTGIRHIKADKRVNVWKPPGRQEIQHCAVNKRQVVIALSGGELVYFEMDMNGQLNEFTEKKELPADVLCMALGRIPSNEQHSRFLAVGLADSTIRIFSLYQADCLAPLTMQGLPSPASSLCIVEMMAGGESGTETGTLYLNIGLSNGVLLRVLLDPVTGGLSDTRTRYLGNKPVKLFRVSLQGCEAVLALSSRPWLSYAHQNRFHLIPLSYEAMEYAACFSSEQCLEGIVAICNNSLRILALEKLGVVFNQQAYQLQYTPRKFAFNPEFNTTYVIETDHNSYTDRNKSDKKADLCSKIRASITTDDPQERAFANEYADEFLKSQLDETVFGAPKAGTGQFSSLLRVMDPLSGDVHQIIRYHQNHAAHALTLVQFGCSPQEQYLVVAVVKGLVLNPRSYTGGALYTYRLLPPRGSKLEFVHETPVEDFPAALHPFQGRLLVAVGKKLRLYDLGKKKLLKKCENRFIPNMITNICSVGSRIMVSDGQESVFWIKFHRERAENQLVIFADDTTPRWVLSMVVLDAATVAVSDKFGNVSVLRLPSDVIDDIEDDPSGVKALWDRGNLGGSSQKCEMLCNIYLGETATRLEKVSLIPGGGDCIIYATLSGTIGILAPFTTKEAFEFFQHLEMHMRTENPSLVGRDHLHFRSLYFPIRNVIDGDLCEMFSLLEPSAQKSIAEEMDKAPGEISRRLEDIRTRYAF
ncbi:Splicing factor 3B subunit 3 [Cichlidogyrus casuarinus]|uniref:Splicing factor 3B subunit 3 n=1 Tax=Cichlidogyrus casuarinus TaxID=1844966 RepID=A0ABD2QEQ5_9PLAT